MFTYANPLPTHHDATHSKTQYDGKYRTRSVRVIFDEEIWEKANVRIGDDVVQRLLIYSYFVSAVMITYDVIIFDTTQSLTFSPFVHRMASTKKLDPTGATRDMLKGERTKGRHH